MRRSGIRLLLAFIPAVLVYAPAQEARAQSVATSNQALPDVLLLLDTSGSMERMLDGSFPTDNKNPLLDPNGAATNICSPGNPSNPNRWGNLVQALTGNMQPFYSCWAMSRAKLGPVYYEYQIGGQQPYDTDYTLPYHRPLSGTGATTCAWAPNELAGGGGAGVGVNNRSAP